MKLRIALPALFICFFIPFLPALAQDNQNQVTSDNPDLRLKLAKVSLYEETGKIDEAFTLIDELKAKYPNNPQVLLAEANLNLEVGNRGAAFTNLNTATTFDPGNEDILDRQRSVLPTQQPFASGGFNFRSTNQALEDIESAATRVNITSDVSAQLDVDNDHLRSRMPLIRVNGSAESFDGDRQRGTFALNKAFSGGDEASASVFANNGTAGLGAQYVKWDDQGSTTLQANYHKPDWDYAQLTIDNGTKDNIRLERKQFITNHLQATLGGGFNHYSLQDDFNAADAAAWDLNLGYTFPYNLSKKPDDQVTFGAYYTVDAEYFSNVDERTDTSGTSYKPFPIQSYEIHSAYVSANKELLSQLYGEIFGGYGVDRFTGSNGPLAGGTLEYALCKNLGLELRAFHGILGGVQGSEKENDLGVNLKWHW